MNLKFSVHFQARMLERSISTEHLKLAIRTPDKRITTFEGRIKVVKKLNGKIIEVIYSLERLRKKEEYLIITAYYLEQAKNI